MVYSKSGLQLTEQFEGCKLTAYWDTVGKVWTIGYGCTTNVQEGLTITQDEAENRLLADVGKSSTAVNQLVNVPLTQDEFDALVDFVFNLGVTNFARSTLRAYINGGHFSLAIAQFDLWDHASGKVVAGLLRRREAEASLFSATVSS